MWLDEKYKMGDTVLGRTTQEKDLGVTLSTYIKVSEQCGIAASLITMWFDNTRDQATKRRPNRSV